MALGKDASPPVAGHGVFPDAEAKLGAHEGRDGDVAEIILFKPGAEPGVLVRAQDRQFRIGPQLSLSLHGWDRIFSVSGPYGTGDNRSITGGGGEVMGVPGVCAAGRNGGPRTGRCECGRHGGGKL